MLNSNLSHRRGARPARRRIDIYLPDLKFGPATSAQSCANASAACPTTGLVVSCIDRVYQRGERLIVRHLLMPGHLTAAPSPCCMAETADRREPIDPTLAPCPRQRRIAQPLAQADVNCFRLWPLNSTDVGCLHLYQSILQGNSHFQK